MFMIIRLGWVDPQNLRGPPHTQLDEEIHVGPHSKRPHTIIEFPSTHMDMGQHNFDDCS